MLGNGRNYFALNSLAVSDAYLQFVIVDIGAYGRECGGGVFRSSLLFKQLEENALRISLELEL